MRVYFWRGKRPNFGDELAPHLLALAGLTAERRPPAEAEVVVVGSIAEHLPPRWPGYVAGIGKAHSRTELDLSSAHVLALRGPLTLRGAHVRGSVALGDPGLLAARLLTERPAVRYEMGVVPHYADRGTWAAAAVKSGAHLIDVTRPALEVLAEIASCERIRASSLHGIIAADALGLPRRWELYQAVQGGGFKFSDYGLALGEDLRPGTWRTARASAVASAQAELADAFAQLAHPARAAA